MSELFGQVALIISVIQRAVADATCNLEEQVSNKQKQKIRSDALAWIFSEDTEDDAGSLEWYCDLVDICPSSIRRFTAQNQNMKRVLGGTRTDIRTIVASCYESESYATHLK